MHRLLTTTDAPRVTELLRRLDAAGIPAQSMLEHTAADLYIGGLPRHSVWLGRKEDLLEAQLIADDLEAERPNETCPACGYDLEGHVGPIDCPECGEPLVAARPERPCPECAEPVPGDFEVCWSCGAPMEGMQTGSEE